MDFSRAFSQGFGLARDLTLSRAYFSYYALFLLLAIAPVAFAPPVMLKTVSAAQGLDALSLFFSELGMLVQYYLILSLAFVAGGLLVKAWAATHAKMSFAGKKCGHEKCLKPALDALPHLALISLAVFLLANTARLALGMGTLVPGIGIFFSIIQPAAAFLAALAFFFADYAVVLGNKNAFAALDESIAIFEKRPLQTLGALGLSAIMSIVVIILGAIPLGVALFLSLATVLFSQTGIVFFLCFALFGIAGAILMLAISFSQVLATGISASAYLQLAEEIGK
ncbi:MAG: hypothetical protein WC792_04315 [Candidatus Micrarchaeia archaeon]